MRNRIDKASADGWITVAIPKPLHKRLKIECARREVDIKDMTARAITFFLDELAEHLPEAT